MIVISDMMGTLTTGSPVTFPGAMVTGGLLTYLATRVKHVQAKIVAH